MAIALPHWRETQALHKLLTSTVLATERQSVDCRRLRDAQPLVLLVLGQSNAGNHGAPGPGAEMLQLVSTEGCLSATDPLPGATGAGASIWARLPTALRARGIDQPLVLGVLGLDGLHAQPWGEAGSPVQVRLSELVWAMRNQGLPPRFVLWQQGESDARRGTSAHDWQSALRRLADVLAASGSQAPILLARSTLCRSAPEPRLWAAAEALEAADPRFRPGADTDALDTAEMRRDGCHFSAAGLSAAADRWAERLVTEHQRPQAAAHY